MIMSYLKFLPICIMFFFVSNLQSQNTIVLFDTNDPFTGVCSEISLGQSVTLSIGSLCGPDIGIVLPDGINLSGITSDTTIVLDQVGEYEILCNTPIDIGVSRTLQTAACITVAENVVPTVGEWGVIVLTLLLLIIGVSAMNGASEKLVLQPV